MRSEVNTDIFLHNVIGLSGRCVPMLPAEEKH